ncbi:hypothetical protein [Thalassobacillus hwangdonensis]|uniref:Fimbrial assembly protein (PilN) n=1 Tax=Thalassobacillus hwangdonensis TaxID=546108 RepID=A0ABW3L0K7_9BACI
MLVEVNLLEQKEQRNMLPLLIGGVFLILALIVFAYFVTQSKQLEAEVAETEAEIAALQSRQTENEQTPVDDVITKRMELVKATSQLEASWISATPVIDRLIALLPERGFFQSFTLVDNGQVNLVVRFDTMQEVAAYTSRLEEESYIHGVEVNHVTAEEVDGSEDVYDYMPRYISEIYLSVDHAMLSEDVGIDETTME